MPPCRAPTDGYVETSGVISIDPTHWTNAIAPAGRRWQVLPDHGRTGSAVTPWPVTATSTPVASLGAADTMRLEYAATLLKAGEVKVQVHLAPTQKFQPGPGLRLALAFDDAAPRSSTCTPTNRCAPGSGRSATASAS